MTGDTINFRRGSTFEFQGQFVTGDDEPIPLTGIVPRVYETWGSGMQYAWIAVTDSLLGKFIVQLNSTQAKKLPLGRSSWFKIQFQYEGSPSSVVFPPVWLDVH